MAIIGPTHDGGVDFIGDFQECREGNWNWCAPPSDSLHEREKTKRKIKKTKKNSKFKIEDVSCFCYSILGD